MNAGLNKPYPVNFLFTLTDGKSDRKAVNGRECRAMFPAPASVLEFDR